MKSSLTKALALILSAMLIFITIPGSNGAAAGTPDEKKHSISEYPQAKGISEEDKLKDIKWAALSETDRKIGSDLLQVIKPELLPEGMTRDNLLKLMDENHQVKRSPSTNQSVDSDMAYVYISLVDGTDPNAVTPYVDQVVNSSKNFELVVAYVEINKLQDLAGLDVVRKIETVTPPVCNSGSVTSEGDSVLYADMARAWGNIDGSGVKIGVISDGVDHLSTSISTGDLPGNVTVLSNLIGGDEGTAMLEIVHDLAPGATLYFHDAGDNVLQFNQAVDALVAAGCKIICDDVSWLNQPFFEDGTVATHIKSMLQSHNVVYVTSAGNFAEQHYQGVFYNDGMGFHDFSRGKSQYKYMYAIVPPGGALKVILQWNEKSGHAACDYDLDIFDYRTYELVASSSYTQSGSGDPYESTACVNLSQTTAGIVEIDVSAHTSVAKNLELILIPYGGTEITSDNVVTTDSIFGHAALSQVITCGAINCLTPNQIESFSSQGPVTMLSETRKKPDVCGADGVSVTGVGFVTPFFGTSAAAPHVAAIAALVLQKHPTLTAAQVKTRITASAYDLGASGYDSTYGSGLIDAYYAALDVYHVTFDPNDGMQPEVYDFPVNSLIAPAPDPVRSGYVFRGWYKDRACTTPWNFASDILRGNITLYAKWGKEVLNVSFVSNCSTSYSPVTVPFNTLLTSPGTPTRDGYIFGGWCSDQECNNLWNFATDLVLDDLILYARWVPQVLPAPANFKQTGAAYDGVTLGWQAVQFANGYEIWRSDTADGTYDQVGITNTNSYAESGLTFNTPYFYKVRAFYNSTTTLYGDYTTVVSATPLPAAPALKASAASYKNIKITWGAVAQATQYELYRAPSASGAYQLLTSTAACSYMNANVTPGSTYYYKARAYTLVAGVKVYGFYSPIVSAKATVATPASVSAARASASSIKVTWSKVADATKYEVWRCTTAATGTFTLVGTASATNFTDKKLKTGSTYWYKVRAYRLEKGKKIYGDFTKVVSAKP